MTVAAPPGPPEASWFDSSKASIHAGDNVQPPNHYPSQTAAALSAIPTEGKTPSTPPLHVSAPAPAAISHQAAATAPVAVAQATCTAPSSAASTPASTPSGTPQNFARKRGRPRKHPLPDPNAKKAKRTLSSDSIASAAAKKKATEAAAARSAASNASSLLSIPDLGRLIPQGSSSDHAETFIQNNLRLFAELFVALQKQATTDNPTGDGSQGTAQLSLDASLGAGNRDAATSQMIDTSSQGDVGSSALASDSRPEVSGVASDPISSNTVSGPSDTIREEIKSKLTDVTNGRSAIQAEMLQLRVDASFFENAQKTVDERISVLRDRIAKHTAVLQREREATRQAREASRKAKKDRKAREKGLRDSEREERRLAETVLQLEREIAAEEEERRRMDEESSDEEGEEAGVAAQDLDPEILAASTSEGTTLSATATPSLAADMTPDRTIGFSDEELAKVLGISTSELAGFSQTLDLPNTLPPPAPEPSEATIPDLLPRTAADDQVLPSDANTDDFDVAAFLELASSFGATQTAEESASTQ
uniref:Uncharacterized protein n=2 Tax=Kalmanozyma brasiliensis (strain GHG001) TaxID=1365824 RepID=V5EQG0_KALBG